jgi:extracellular elastinolytic metalloproteinase
MTRAVMDAAGSERAAIMGVSEGGPITLLFAATYPERTAAAIGYGCGDGTNDADPVPSFASPHATEATLIFEAINESGGPDLGRTPLRRPVRGSGDARRGHRWRDSARLEPCHGRRHLRAPRAGARLRHEAALGLRPGMVKELVVSMPRNLSSSANGASASGDGINLDKLIDDTESTN